MGDSITDGYASTVDTNNRWPDHLARRLAAQNIRAGVLNVGISGNRLFTDGIGPNAQARFDREVLVQPGATHVIVLEGNNDVGMARRSELLPASSNDIIAAYQQLIARAHAQGLKIYFGTLTPFDGTTVTEGYWSAENSATRQAVNQWIRTATVHDGIVDFDAA